MFKNEWNEVRSGWIILGAFLIVLVGQLMFTLPGMTFLNLLEMANRHEATPSTILQSPFMLLATQGAGTFGGIAATLVAYRTINKKNPNEMHVHGPVKHLIIGLLLGFVSILVIFILLYSTNQISLQNPLTSPIWTSYIIVYFILYTLVAIFEELFFRGYVMQTLVAKGNSKVIVYIVSATLFTVVHLFNPNVAVIGLINIFIIGLLFAYMFAKTGNLLMPIGFHMTWNFFQGAIFGFPVSGTDPHGLYIIDVAGGMALFTGGAFGLEASIITTIIIVINYFLIKTLMKSENETV